MNRFVRTSIVIAALVSVADATSSFNGNCTGLDVIINYNLSSDSDCLYYQSIKLNESDCSVPLNGICDENKLFYASADLDPKTNLPNLCCSLQTGSNFTFSEYVTRQTSNLNLPNCQTLPLGSTTALRGASQSFLADVNGTITNILVSQCQGLLPIGKWKRPDTMSCFGNSFVNVVDSLPTVDTFVIPHCQADLDYSSVIDDDHCLVVTPDANSTFQCPSDMWLKGFVNDNSDTFSSLPMCCKAQWNNDNSFVRLSNVSYIAMNNQTLLFQCDNGTFITEIISVQSIPMKVGCASPLRNVVDNEMNQCTWFSCNNYNLADPSVISLASEMLRNVFMTSLSVSFAIFFIML